MKKLENVYQDASLLKKALIGEANEEELQELEEMLSQRSELRKIYEDLQNEGSLSHSFNDYQQFSSKKAYQHFLQHLQETEKQDAPKSKVRFLRVFQYAAAVILLAVGVSFYMLNAYQEEVVSESVAQIHAGSQHAILTLPGGKVIDVGKNDVNMQVDDVQVKYKRGVLSYYTSVTVRLPKSASNELVIPRGGENTVILSDGTKVHLNAGTKLIYPVRFVGKRRIVTLEGEAYFDVQKDEKCPFVVHTRFGEVTVLGTSFNVNAYNDASACYTTLVNGKVNVQTQGQELLTLLPGEQAVMSAEGVEKRKVDVKEYVGWASGVYVFNNRTLEELMNTFERWYDIQVYYETPALRGLTYSGDLKRNSTINTFLDALELTGDIYYKINGRNILIYENK